MAHLASYVHTTSIMQDIRRFVVSVSGVTRATLRWVCLGCHQTIYGHSGMAKIEGCIFFFFLPEVVWP